MHIIHTLDSLGGSYGFAVGLSISVTFIETSVLSSLITLLLASTCVSGKGIKAMSTGSTLLYEIPPVKMGRNDCRCLLVLQMGRCRLGPLHREVALMNPWHYNYKLQTTQKHTYVKWINCYLQMLCVTSTQLHVVLWVLRQYALKWLILSGPLPCYMRRLSGSMPGQSLTPQSMTMTTICRLPESSAPSVTSLGRHAQLILTVDYNIKWIH